MSQFSQNLILSNGDPQSHRLLTIKCPSNKFEEGDLLRIVYQIKDTFDLFVKTFWFETGKQNQKHIHCLVKGEMFTQEHLNKWLSQRKYVVKYYTEKHNLWDEPVLIKTQIPKNKFTYHVQKIEDEDHFFNIVEEYRFKEKLSLVSFVD